MAPQVNKRRHEDERCATLSHQISMRTTISLVAKHSQKVIILGRMGCELRKFDMNTPKSRRNLKKAIDLT